MLGELLVLILKTAFSIVLIALVARFLAQLARADVHNPLAHTILQITNPFLLPLRRIVPGMAGMDMAAVVCIWVAQIVLASLVFVLMGSNPVEYMGQILSWGIVSIAGAFLVVLQWTMIIVVVSSWLTMGQAPHPIMMFLQQLVEPFVSPFRKLNLQIGMLDLSYIVVFLVILILRDFVIGRMILAPSGYGEAIAFGTRGFSPFFGL